MNPLDLFNRTFSMSEMTKGKAASAFAQSRTGAPVFVLKNSKPYRVIITMEDYEILEHARSEKVEQ